MKCVYRVNLGNCEDLARSSSSWSVFTTMMLAPHRARGEGRNASLSECSLSMQQQIPTVKPWPPHRWHMVKAWECIHHGCPLHSWQTRCRGFMQLFASRSNRLPATEPSCFNTILVTFIYYQDEIASQVDCRCLDFQCCWRKSVCGVYTPLAHQAISCETLNLNVCTSPFDWSIDGLWYNAKHMLICVIYGLVEFLAHTSHKKVPNASTNLKNYGFW